MGRLPVADAAGAGTWRIDGPPALVKELPKWGGLYSTFARIQPAMQS